ncbi:anti-sigma factor domain-containing protein [Psychrobacillus vulpis]|uniref:Anti-sigma factor domain-containing protein n=1 Tax=Psychrobacillus vulpis TaxID=2325572 RepID=A0A544TUS2_9BACI|nr:anti-sigma factor domain-containing protein [Psychrobacillus vulpis]TQR21209.1 anti-sigma factor domain-containing protein [Psychrobacillus vulpis]
MMRTYRGIVCEKKNKYMVFLTKEGEFLRGIPLGSPNVGEEAEFHVVSAASPRQKRLKPFFIAPALIAAVLLVFIVTSLFPNTNSALAYVQLEGETALELGVNQKGNVVSLRSLDEYSLLNIDEWEGLSLVTVLDKAVRQMGPESAKLELITVYKSNEQLDTKKLIEEAVRTVQKEHTDRSWHVSESTVEERDKANKNNQTIQQLRQTEKAPVKEEEKEPIKPTPTPTNQSDHQNESNKQENNLEKEHNNKEKQTPPKETNDTPKEEKQPKTKQQKQEEKEQEKWEKQKQKQDEKQQAKEAKEEEEEKKNRDKWERKNEHEENDDHDDKDNDNEDNQD